VGLLLARLRMHNRSYPSDVEDLASSITYLSDSVLNRILRVVLENNLLLLNGAIKIFWFQQIMTEFQENTSSALCRMEQKKC
jgi:hypothetical protein